MFITVWATRADVSKPMPEGLELHLMQFNKEQINTMQAMGGHNWVQASAAETFDAVITGPITLVRFNFFSYYVSGTPEELLARTA